MNPIIKGLKWFYPGMGVKRWILLCALGVVCIIVGTAEYFSKRNFFLMFSGIVVAFAGLITLIIGIRQMIRTFISIFLPQREKDLVDIVYQKRQLGRGPKIAVIGGGTGLSTLLQGLKEYTSNITAIVTVADDGGSSGRLRNQFDVLPPGDIRNCLVALADAEPLMRDLFQYRFEDNTEFGGHSFGNLFILAMSKVTKGDFEKAVKESSKILAIRGRVIPSTLRKVSLLAEYEDGTKTAGETKISQGKSPIKKVELQPADSSPTQEAVEAINQADVIILGPGSLYTSVIPNLLIEGIKEAVSKAKAIKIYVCNIMTQPGETNNYSASGHLKAIVQHTRSNIINCCIVNTAQPSQELLSRYKEENAFPVAADITAIKNMGIKVVQGDLISAKDFVRHDPKKLARKIMELVTSLK